MPSVAHDQLVKLQQAGISSDFLGARLQYSESSTLLSHHIRPMVGQRRIYPTMVIPQASGRVGISDPPIGNFTADLRYGPHGLRDVVAPDRGVKWVSCDWTAIEASIVSHRCQDPHDTEARRRSLDLHTVTAIRMFKYPEPQGEPTKEWLSSGPGLEWRERVGFTKQIRDGVKNTRYTVQYSKRPETMKIYAVKLGMDPGKLVEFGKRYLASKPWLTRWKAARWAEAWRLKEARTAFGRRRRLWGDRYNVEKEGLNHEVQGTVADMMKLTMVALAHATGAAMALQRHDGWYSIVPVDFDRMDLYRGVVEREWVIDGRPITFEAEYEEITHGEEEAREEA